MSPVSCFLEDSVYMNSRQCCRVETAAAGDRAHATWSGLLTSVRCHIRAFRLMTWQHGGGGGGGLCVCVCVAFDMPCQYVARHSGVDNRSISGELHWRHEWTVSVHADRRTDGRHARSISASHAIKSPPKTTNGVFRFWPQVETLLFMRMQCVAKILPTLKMSFF